MIYVTPSGGEKTVGFGRWGEDAWELVLSRNEPDAKLCTAAACVAISNIDTGEVVLTRNVHSQNPSRQNKWEMPAGHIDDLPGGGRETPQQAVARESLEETGFIVDEPATLFGFRRVYNVQPSQYPPISYMPYYWATTRHTLAEPTDPGQPAVRTFPIEALHDFVEAGTMNLSELEIIEYGLIAARQELRSIPGAY